MMRRSLMTGASLALTLGSAAAWSWANVPQGAPFPRLSLPAVNGGSVEIALGPARAMCVLYLRPDQERSRQALAELIALHRKYRGQPVAFFAVATATHDGRRHAAELSARLKPPFPLLLDEKGRLRGLGGLFVYPTTGVVDQAARLRYAYAGHRPDYMITVERQLRALLGVGPPPEQIVDVDRNASSAEQRRAQRTTAMQAALRAKEAERARNRLAATRALLGPQTLQLVLSVYDRWAELLPPPSDARLAGAASRIRARSPDLAGEVALLRRLAGEPALQDPAQLWLGRALAAQGQKAAAIEALSQCATSRPLRGQCAFELARLVAGDDAERAVSLCRRGLQLALEEKR